MLAWYIWWKYHQIESTEDLSDTVLKTNELYYFLFWSELKPTLTSAVRDTNPMDTDGSTPLHEAARNGHLEICEMIADKFVDKNPKDQKGRTPYHEAAQWGRVQVCAWFISW